MQRASEPRWKEIAGTLRGNKCQTVKKEEVTNCWNLAESQPEKCKRCDRQLSLPWRPEHQNHGQRSLHLFLECWTITWITFVKLMFVFRFFIRHQRQRSSRVLTSKYWFYFLCLVQYLLTAHQCWIEASTNVPQNVILKDKVETYDPNGKLKLKHSD